MELDRVRNKNKRRPPLYGHLKADGLWVARRQPGKKIVEKDKGHLGWKSWNEFK